MEQRHIDEGEKHPTLGPHYFAAREAAKTFMARFEAEQFEPLVKSFADKFYQEMHDRLESYLLSDAEQNLQGEIWCGVDNAVNALVTGERWALERYTLGKYGDGEKARAAVARHIPKEVQDARIADLEAENKRLREWLDARR